MRKSRLLKNLLFGSYTYGKPRSEEVELKGPQRRHSSRMKPQPPPTCLLGWCFLPVSSSQLLHSWLVLSKTKYHECRTLCVSSYELDSGWHYFLETVPLWTGIRHAIPTMLASAHTCHDTFSSISTRVFLLPVQRDSTERSTSQHTLKRLQDKQQKWPLLE